uniref:Uncharacterized protein n=1 Tax=Pseudo-nitzschia australis TaxID=44445 RepID=A0A7S4EI72_9STRA|eukprot:CAMPEP_0168164784 /NCGR_PEP_ID=MMETSP0139_2-20121125/1127_1 /TAXON_ID=44445 /ORGANISM="Pseudo-nitzschia australis, Strain 10249 10 AB" /LENGTH=862 /DNA_ID=CAMNT_0008081835 /DNA_START=7 /DNA_END=2595 /DNA_ORIENTATION=+
MPSLIKAKSSKESKGFVRRMLKKGTSFKSLNNGNGESLINGSSGSHSFGKLTGNEGSKWRPRHNPFERLDGDEDDDSLSAAFQLEKSYSSSWGIDNISTYPSTESESGDYRRDIMFEKKATALIQRTPSKNKDNSDGRKREFSPIKPPGKDTSTIRGSNFAKNTPLKKQKEELEWANSDDSNNIHFSDNTANIAGEDPFFSTTGGSSATDSFGFQINSNDGRSNENITIKSPFISRYGEKSLNCHQTPSLSTKNPRSSYNTVVSDPTDFFSKEQTTKLTMSNLAKMDSSINNTNDITANKDSTMDGMERMVKERKFYQFTIDEDKASTVVESTFQLPADYRYGDKSYSMDDDETEFSCSQTSQGTRIQQRSKTKENTTNTSGTIDDFLSTPSPTKKKNVKVKEFDVLFQNNNNHENHKGKEFDAFSPHSTKKDDLFPNFAGNHQQEDRHKLATESDISSSWGDAYFERSYKSSNEFGGASQTEHDRHKELHMQQASTRSLSSHQVSVKSLVYSPSPVHNKSAGIPQNGRQPLTLKNTQFSGGNNHAFTSAKKAGQGSDWFRSESTRERDTKFQFDDFATQSPSKARNCSIGSSNIQLPPSDHFDSLPMEASAKENLAIKSNRHEGFDGDRRAHQKIQFPLRKNDENDEDDDDDDSFDDIGSWENPPSFGNGISRSQRRNSNNNRPHISRNDNTYSRPSRNQYINDNYVDDDNRSADGFSVGKKVSRPSRSPAGSYAKPLALPSNAIVASMLFRTHYDIDQNDVEEKINKLEEEESKQKEIRHLYGDIPDAVHADADYMTTVSSFSDATSAYLHDSWRKPCRDLVSHFSNARALDMDYRPSVRRLPTRQASRVEQQQSGLFEA